MSDFKSKLPDLNELSSMAGKLFKGLKNSVNEIIDDYKQKRAGDPTKEEPAQEVKSAETKDEKIVEAVKTSEAEPDPKPAPADKDMK